MPGFEVIDRKEEQAVMRLFQKAHGVMHRYGFDALRNGITPTADFEQSFAKVLRVRYVHAVTSGTAALKVALKALDIKPGDEVITQSFTFVATVEAIIEVGAIPVITEIDESLNMDPKDLAAKITKKTRAIIPVHMLGAPARMDEIMRIAKKYKLLVLEDACEAPGGTYKGKALGTIGDMGAFSFDFGKTITTGEGGMVATNNKERYERAKEYADHGHQNNPKLPRAQDSRRMAGFNFRMMELQGALGLAQLAKLPFILKKQREHKSYLQQRLREIPEITFRDDVDAKGEIADTLILLFKDKKTADTFTKKLKEHGYGNKNIPDAISWHYAGTWTHMLPQFDRYRGKDLMKLWPRSTDLVSRAVALPIMVKSSKAQLNRLAGTILTICKEL